MNTSFKQYLKEAPDLKSPEFKIYNYLYKTAEMLAVYIPFHPALIKRVFGGHKRVVGFHILGKSDLQSLVNLQGSKKSISISSEYVSGREFGLALVGISKNEAGMIAKIEGNALLKMPLDLFSKPDPSGSRWVDSGTIKNLTKEEHRKPFEEFITALRIARRTVFDKVTKGVTDPFGSPIKIDNVHWLWASLDGKLKYQLIKETLDAYERVMAQHTELLTQVFYDLQSMHTLRYRESWKTWNEIIVNEIKVLEIFVIDEPHNIKIMDSPWMLEIKKKIPIVTGGETEFKHFLQPHQVYTKSN